MLKRFLSLVLAMALLFTAAVPAACAEVVTPEAALEMIPQLQAMFKEMTSEEKSLLEQELAGYGVDLDDISWLSSELMNDANAPSAAAEPSKASAQNPWERSHELEANTSEEYSIFHADFSLFRILSIHSSEPSIATGSMRPDRESYSFEELSAPSTPNPKCSLYYSVHAHSAGTATITYRFARDMIGLRVYNNGSKEFFTQDTNEYTLTVHVKVPKQLNPPKVEVRLVPDSTVMQVTGVHQAVDFLDTALDLLDPIGIAGKVIEKIIPESSKVVDAVTGTKEIVDVVKEADSSIVPTPQEQAKIDRGSKKYTTSRRVRLFYYTFALNQKYKSLYLPFFPKPSTIVRMLPTLLRFARNELIERSIMWLLKQHKVPRLEPEVYLEVVVTNPDNTVPLYYNMNIDAPRVTHSSKDMVPITPGTPLQTTSDAYSEQVIHPGSEYRNVHKFKLEPEWVFNEANYDLQMSTSSSYSSSITVSGSWGEWKGIDGKEPGGSFAESTELDVISTLGPKSEYEQMEHFFSDVATNVFNVLEGISQLFTGPQSLISDEAWIELLDSLPEGAAFMTPVDQLPPPPVISAPGNNP